MYHLNLWQIWPEVDVIWFWIIDIFANTHFETTIEVFLKVGQIRNVSFKPTILPKNERTNSFFLPNSTKNEFVRSFLEEFKDTKKSFWN